MAGEAFFEFDTNAEAVAQRIESAMRQIVTAVSESARAGGVGGVPAQFGDRLVSDMEKSVRRQRELMAQLVSEARAAGTRLNAPQLRSGIGSPEQVAQNLFADLRSSVERSLKQLDPGARAALVVSRDFEKLLQDAQETVAREVHQIFEETRAAMRGSGSRVPRTSVEDLRASISPRSDDFLEAEAARVEKMTADAAARSAAEQAALATRESADTSEAKTRQRAADEESKKAASQRAAIERAHAEAIREENRRTQEATEAAKRSAADLIARGAVRGDPYLRAQGVFPDPAGGSVPFRRVAGGAEPLSNPIDIQRVAAAAEELRQFDEMARRLEQTPDFRRVGTSPFYESGDQTFRGETRQGIFGYQDIEGDIRREAEAAAARAAEYKRLRAAEKSAAGESAPPPTGFFGGLARGAFGRGFGGQGFGLDSEHILTNLGTTAGSAIRYSVAYGGLYQIAQAARVAIAEFEDFQDSQTDYQVALGESGSVTDSFTQSLEGLTVQVGENVGAAFDAAARGVRAFRTELDTTQDDLDKIGYNTAAAAQIQGLIAQKSLTDATGDIVSTGSAFNLDSSQLASIPNAVAETKRNIGGDPAQIAQGLSSIAVTAKEAGYNLQEASDLVGLVQSRTDESGSAVATRISRIFSIISGSTGKNLIADLNRLVQGTNIDPNGTAKQQIEGIAAAYQKASPAVQGLIRNQLGGTANLRELLPLLNEQKRLQDALAAAKANPGAGYDEYTRKVTNFLGVLDRISGHIKNIAVDAATSDLFAPFAVAAVSAEKLLDMIDALLGAYKRLHDAISAPLNAVGLGGLHIPTVATAGAEVAGGAYLFNRFRQSTLVSDVAKTDGLTGVLAKRIAAEEANTAATVVNTEAKTAEAAASARSAVADTAESAASAASAAADTAEASQSLLAAAGARVQAAGSAVGGFAAARPGLVTAVAAVVGFEVGKSIIDAGNRANQDASLSQQQLDAINKVDYGSRATPENLDKVATSLRETIKKIDEDRKGFGALFSRGQFDDIRKKDEAEAALFEKWSKIITAESERRINQGIPGLLDAGPFWTPFQTSSGHLTDSLHAVSFEGLSAASSMEDLTGAMDQFIASGGSARQAFLRLIATFNTPENVKSVAPQKFAAETVLGLKAQSQTFLDDAAKNTPGTPDYDAIVRSLEGNLGGADNDVYANDIGGVVKYRLQQADFQEKLQKQLAKEVKALHLKPGEVIDQATYDKLLEQAFIETGIADSSALPADVTAHAPKILADLFAKNFKNYKGTEPPGPLSPAQAELLSTQLESTLAGITGDQFGQRSFALITTLLGTYRAKIDSGNRGTIQPLIDKWRAARRQSIIDGILAREQTAEALLDPSDDAAAIRGLRVPAIDRAITIARANTQQLVAIIQGTDHKTLELVKERQRADVEVARAALASSQAMLAALVAALPDPEIINQQLINAQAQTRAAEKYFHTQLHQYKQFKLALSRTPVEPDITSGTTEDTGDTAAQIAAARASAEATRIGGGIAAARAAIQTAQANLAAAKEGTVEYYNALSALYSAQQQLTDAILANQDVLRQLSGDITDPVEQARDALAAARAKLASDQRSGKAPDVINADKLAVEQAQNAAEAAKFQQRLSDAQTADDLGQISHAAYIRYLNHEHDRLTAIKHRTRQQQDELNTIDKALQDAISQMSGQFNLGDIDVNGLVYQTRRFAAQHRADVDAAQRAAAGSILQNIAINIDGADVGQIRRVLRDILGADAGARRTTANRKV